MKVLIADDEPLALARMRQALACIPEVELIAAARSGETALQLIRSLAPDIAILDIEMPVMDGLGVVARLRQSDTIPEIIFVTAFTQHAVQAFELNAADYLTKPFHMQELLARVRALIRRAGGHASAELVCGDIVLDTRHSRASVAGQGLTLTSHEFRVLDYLMHHPGVVVSRSDFIEHIYAQDYDRDSNTVEVFIARLRKKLPEGVIETVRGLGYRLVAP